MCQMINLEAQVIFYYYGVVKATGNEGRFKCCFNHAVKMALNQGIIIETEIITGEDFVECYHCANDE